MRLRKKKSLIDQASEYVDSVRPQIESALSTAVDSTKDFVESTALPLLAEARDKAVPVITDAYADAKDKATPYLSDAKDKAASSYADARKNAGPALADAREKASASLSDVYSDAKVKAAPLIASGTALATEKAVSAKSLADAKVAQLKGEPVKKKGSKLKKVALFVGIAAVVGVVAKKLQGDKAADNWQSSYVPTPPPAAPKTTSAPSPSAPMAAAEEPTVDAAGSSPDEALADAVEAPHAVTTPDDPADIIPIDGAAPVDETDDNK